MKKRRIQMGVVDYGMGNLHSVEKALALQGANVRVSDQLRLLRGSDILVLPGVGSFGAAMKNLARKKLDDFIRHWIDDGKPYLGICLGLQLLFEKSEEDPEVPGLGALKGRVVKFRREDFKPSQYTIPHMGWNSAAPVKKQDRNFRGLNPKNLYYFVHTFFPKPFDRQVEGTRTRYGKPFCSSVSTKNIFASQFHPEKSGPVGLKLLSNVIQGLAA